jgi:hypothetical protein
VEAPKPDESEMTKEVRSDSTGFVYKLPSDWYTKTDKKSSQYDLAFGPTTGDFTSNINVVDENYSGSLSEYAEANMKTIQKFKNLKLIDNGRFVTNTGADGIRVITEHNNFNDRYLRQTFYFFKSSKSGQFIILTSTAPVAVGAKQQAMFDSIARTFRTFPAGSDSASTTKDVELKKDADTDAPEASFSSGKTVSLESLGFTYMVPSTWTVTTDEKISKYPLARGTTVDNFTANFNAVDEDYSGGIDAYVEANMVTLRKSFKNLTVVQQGRFTTESGVEGRRVITEHNTFNDRYLRQTFYFFKSSKGKTWLVLTSSALRKNGAELQPTFDSIMRSLRQVPVR